MKTNVLTKMANKIPSSFTRKVGKMVLSVKKHSPEILVTAGCVGAAASIVTACKATLKVDEILDETKEKIDKIHDTFEKYPEKYSEEDKKKDLTVVYIKTGIKFVKIYLPTAIIFGLSVTSILTSNNILRKRNAALAAAYATLDRTFKEYRDRVTDRFGERVEYELFNGIRAEEIEERITDENGNEKTVKKTVDSLDPRHLPAYTMIFDSTSSEHTTSAKINYSILKARIEVYTETLKRRGYLFLNEVRRDLDFKEIKEGNEVGWVYDPKNPAHANKVIDLGLFDMRKDAIEFRNEDTNWVYLIPKVDGPILDVFESYDTDLREARPMLPITE